MRRRFLPLLHPCQVRVLLTRYTHSCVRIEADGRVLVIEASVWCETEAPTCSWSESSPVRRSRSQVSGWSTRRPTQPVYGDEPSCANLGYVVEGTLYHPGDALDVPEEDVETLLVPIQGCLDQDIRGAGLRTRGRAAAVRGNP